MYNVIMPTVPINWSRLLPFNKAEIEKLGNISGVYRLSKKADDGKYYVFFIGSAENIKEKFLLHLSNKESDIRLRE